MVFIKFIKIESPKRVNPYLILGIPKNADEKTTKKNFRQKLMEFRNNDELRAKICLAYDIIVNRNFYRKCGDNIYEIDTSKMKPYIAGYYYCFIGDSYNFIMECEKNPKILEFKDSLERNLLYLAARNGHISICNYLINKGIDVNAVQKTGSTALHGAAYYGQTEVVKLLLNYGAKTNIYNNYGNLPIDEAMTEEIKKILKESEKDPIVKLYQSLTSKNIATKLIPIYLNKKVVAKKIVCKLINLPEYYKNLNIEKNWITAWHGTNFGCLESIAEIGLKPAGEKAKDGKGIEVCISHISRIQSFNNIHDWARGIFVSPSIFYCAHPAYAKEISCFNELWKVFVEVKVNPNSFTSHESTCYDYKPKIGEPIFLEYRIRADNEKYVQVVSLTFIKSEFFGKVEKFEEGRIMNLF
jgi:hypothetical protein